MISIAHIFAPCLSFLTGAGSLSLVARYSASAPSCFIWDSHFETIHPLRREKRHLLSPRSPQLFVMNLTGPSPVKSPYRHVEKPYSQLTRIPFLRRNVS